MRHWRRVLALLVCAALLPTGFGLAEEPAEAQEPAVVEAIEEPAEEEAIGEAEAVEEPEPAEEPESAPEPETEIPEGTEIPEEPEAEISGEPEAESPEEPEIGKAPTDEPMGEPEFENPEEPEATPEPEIGETLTDEPIGDPEPEISTEPEATDDPDEWPLPEAPVPTEEALEMEAVAADSDFEIDENGELLRYNGSDADVTIPENVTVIGAAAFEFCSVKSVKLPQGVTTICDAAFKGCLNLRSVEIPQSVTEIGNGAFSDCRALQALNLPDGITSIGEAAFSGCYALKSVNIPKGLTRIENATFYNVPFSDTLEISEGVTFIGDAAFVGLRAKRLVLPRSLKRIETNAFRMWGCGSEPLTLTIPGSVEWIGDGAFRDCGWLIRVVAEPGVKELGNSVFEGCTRMSTVSFSEGLTRMGDNVLAGAQGMETLTLPASLTSIGENLFGDLYMPGKSKFRINVVAPAGSYVQTYCRDHSIPWRAPEGLGAINANLKNGDAIPIDGKPHTLSWDAVPGAASYAVVIHGFDGYYGEHIKKTKFTLDADLFHDEQEVLFGIFAYDVSNQLLAQTEFTLRVVSSGQTLQVPEEIYLGLGESYTLKPESSIRKDSFSYVAEKVDGEVIATVSKKGKITAKRSSSTTVRVTSKKGGLRVYCRVNVLKEPDWVELNARELTLLKGASFQLSGEIVDGFSNAPLKYKSSKPKIAKVDADGTVHALRTGTAKITCSAYNGVKAVCTVEVKSAPKSLRLPEEGIKLSVGQVAPLEFEGSYAVNSYASSDESVATVDDKGICTARQTGTTTITAHTSDGLTGSCTLTVVPAPDEILPIEDIYLGEGETGKLAPVALYRGEEVPANFTYSFIYGESTATIGMDGTVTGRYNGTAEVVAMTQNGVRTKFTIQVRLAPARLVPDAKACKLGTGDSFRLHVQLVDPDGREAVSKLTCQSSKDAIATVEQAKGEPGVFVIQAGNKTGSATITLQAFNGKKASCKVSVVNPSKTFRLNEAQMTLGVEETGQLSYTLDKKDMFTRVEWSSTDERVATVDEDGRVTAHRIGSATIRGVSAGGMSGECAVTVVPAPTQLDVPETLTLRKGQKYQLEPKIDPGSHCSFTFTCFDSDVLTVDKDTGLISVKKKPKYRSAVITVKTHNELIENVYVSIQ